MEGFAQLLSADAEVTFLLHKQQLLKLIETASRVGLQSLENGPIRGYRRDSVPYVTLQ